MASGKGGAKSNAVLHARIKKMMQSDEDVGKVAKASPALIGACSRCTWGGALCQRGCPPHQAARRLSLALRGPPACLLLLLLLLLQSRHWTFSCRA